MFHAGGHKGVCSRGRSSGLGRPYPHFLSHVDWKAPLRCGILFCTFSCILIVVGVMLTWLGIRRSELNKGVHDVFGESVPITGPILLAVGGLLLILAVRQFYVAHVRKKAHNLALKKKELGEHIATDAAEREYGENDFMDTEADLDKDGTEDANSVKPPLISGGCYDSGAFGSPGVDSQCVGGYVWPPVPLQHPYYSMALMVYKDAFLNHSDHVISPGLADTYSCSPVVTTGLDMSEVGNSTGQKTYGVISSSLSSPQPNPAMLATASTTMQPQTQPASCTLPMSTHGPRQEGCKIFPADYLPPNNRKHAQQNRTNGSINSLPNPTAFMMLRTLELQETI